MILITENGQIYPFTFIYCSIISYVILSVHIYSAVQQNIIFTLIITDMTQDPTHNLKNPYPLKTHDQSTTLKNSLTRKKKEKDKSVGHLCSEISPMTSDSRFLHLVRFWGL